MVYIVMACIVMAYIVVAHRYRRQSDFLIISVTDSTNVTTLAKTSKLSASTCANTTTLLQVTKLSANTTLM